MAAFRKTQTLIYSIFLFLVTTVATHAADANFSWTANSETVSGYKIHYGSSSRSYDFEVDVPQPVAVNSTIVAMVSGLQEGQTYYFAATAYLGAADSTIEESDYSDEVVHTVPGTATPQPPIADDISLQGSEDTLLSGQLEADNSDGTTLTFTVVSQPGHGTIIVEDDTGSFTYTPAPNYSGDDSFSYTAANSAGTSNQAIVTIHLSPVNDSPVADSFSFSVNEDGNYSGTLSATDIDGGNLVYSLAAQAQNGTATISPNGSFTYTPGQDLFGPDSFTFTVSDGSSTSNTATVNIFINPVNKAPIASDSTFSVDQNTAYSGQLIAADADGDALSFNLATGPEKGTIVINSNGSFTYTPHPGASGADLFTYVATDEMINSNAGTVNILIAAAVSSQAAEATFSWTANIEPISGYKIHYGTSSRNYTFVFDVGLPVAVNGSIVATVQGLQEGQTYYFAATAYSTTEESDYSVEVVYTVPGATSPGGAVNASSPTILRIISR